MKTFFAFVEKESRHILRDVRTMLILFVMPIVLMLIFGFAIRTDVSHVRTVIVTASQDRLTEQLTVALGQSEYFDICHTVATPQDAERLIRRQQADLAVVFAPHFASRRGDIQLLTDGADPMMAQQYANYARQIIGQQLADRAAPARPEVAGSPQILMSLLYNPQMKSSYNFVPGIMGMLLLLICAMMTSVSIVREKEQGTMEVLLASPVRPLLVIIAKAVPYMLLSVVVLVVILLMARFVLSVPLSGNVPAILLVSALYILLALALGLLISTMARRQLVALIASGVMLLLPSVMLSGMMFPVESMPAPLQWISALLPPSYYIRAMRKLMIMGVGLHQVQTEAAVLGGMLALILSTALLKFNKRLK